MSFEGLIDEGESIAQDASLDKGNQRLVLNWARLAGKGTNFFDGGRSSGGISHVLSMLNCPITLGLAVRWLRIQSDE